MKNYTDALLEAYDIKESKNWRNPNRDNHNKTFWKFAKLNILDVDGFHAENNYHLKYDFDTNLTVLFDDNGLLKSKASYGIIKNAKPENNNEDIQWALKALMKFWVLQFKDNAITTDDIYEELGKKADEFISSLNNNEEAAINNIAPALLTDKLKDEYLSMLSTKAKTINHKNAIKAAIAEMNGEEKSKTTDVSTEIKDVKFSNFSVRLGEIDKYEMDYYKSSPTCRCYKLIIGYTVEDKDNSIVHVDIEDVTAILCSLFDIETKDYKVSLKLKGYGSRMNAAKETAKYDDSEYNYKKWDDRSRNNSFKNSYGLEKRFWDNAEKNIIDCEAFKDSYKHFIDTWKLDDLFEDKYGKDYKFKSKSSYSKLIDTEKAVERWGSYEHEAIGAALKFWELQFIENARTLGEIERERREQKRAAEEAEEKARKEEEDRLCKPITEVEHKYNEDNGATFNETVRRLLIAHPNNLIKKMNELAKVENNYLDFWAEQTVTGSSKYIKHYNTNIQSVNIKDVHSKLFCFWEKSTQVSITATVIVEDNSTDENLLKLSKEFTMHISSSDSTYARQVILDFFNGKFDEFIKLINKGALINGDISSLRYEYDTIVAETDKAKNSPQGIKFQEINARILAAVDKGEQPDDNILNELEKAMESVRHKASSEASSWYGPSDDGDSGAAYEQEMKDGAKMLMICFKDLYWKSYNKQVPSWHGGTRDELLNCMERIISYGSVEDFEFRRATV